MRLQSAPGQTALRPVYAYSQVPVGSTVLGTVVPLVAYSVTVALSSAPSPSWFSTRSGRPIAARSWRKVVSVYGHAVSPALQGLVSRCVRNPRNVRSGW